MAKFFGNVGYGVTAETVPGVWEQTITQKPYRGDIVNQRFQRQPSGEVNDNINVANEISIVADKFAHDNLSSMLYVEYKGAKWKIKSVEVAYPRLVLAVGGLYNE